MNFDLTGKILKVVSKNKETEPLLQPLTEDKLNTNPQLKEIIHELTALEFWSHIKKAFFDIRVFDSVAQRHFNQSLQASYLRK